MARANELAVHIPLLRRYARALTGSQDSGDAFVAAALETIIAAPGEFPDGVSPRVGLYAVFHAVWSSAAVEVPEPPTPFGDQEAVIKKRLEMLTPRSRQALLLTALEGFSDVQAARIMGISSSEIAELVAAAIADIDRQTATTVLIIEDEPIIAMDLESIVESLGHTVAATADTRKGAVRAAKEFLPGLVLADIQLADGSSGIDAVKDIMESFDVPVIFITAYPERLLTGERPEPTFLITKPFQTETVKATISQALFFKSTEPLAMP